MSTQVVKLDKANGYDDVLAEAARLIEEGQLVAFPTETVYGVGARVDSAEAMERLLGLKDRPPTKPFSLHIGAAEDVHRYVPEMSTVGRRVIRRAWPGPLAVVFRVDSPENTPAVAEFGTDIVERLYHEGTIGVRCPDEPFASALLSRVGHPVVAASANRAGRRPPRNITEVLSELDGDVALAIDGGTTQFEEASTVARLDGGHFEILREGVLDARTLNRYATVNILFVCSGNTCRSPMAEVLCQKAIATQLECSVAELADRRINVQSAGASAFGGGPASSGAIEAVTQYGVDLNGHLARSLDQVLINQADHVFCMTQGHREAVVSLVPEANEKTKLLAEGRDISDPFGGSVDEYQACAKEIQASLETRMKEIAL